MFISFSRQLKSKPCLVKRASSGDMSDSEYVNRDNAASEGAIGSDSAMLTAMHLTTLTLAVTPGTMQRRSSPYTGITSSMCCSSVNMYFWMHWCTTWFITIKDCLSLHCTNCSVGLVAWNNIGEWMFSRWYLLCAETQWVKLVRSRFLWKNGDDWVQGCEW